MSPILRTAGARLLTLPLATGLGLATSYITIDRYGANVLGIYGVLISFPALFVFADLGVGAPLNNEIATNDCADQDPHVRHVLLTVVRALALSAMLALTLGCIITAAGAWGPLLGRNADGPRLASTAAICWSLFAIAIPLNLGQRLLVALGKLHIQVLLQLVQPALTFALIFVGALTGRAGSWPPLAFYLSLTGTGLVMTAAAYRSLPNALTWALKNALMIRRIQGAPIGATVRPMFLIMIALPISTQSDRLIISHFGNSEGLNSFALAAQFYGPLLSLITVTSAALWPMVARKRRNLGVDIVMEWPSLVAIAGVGLASALAASLVVRPAASLISNGAIEVTASLAAAFALLVAVQAVQAPLGNMLTSVAGLRFQSRLILLALPINLSISIWLTSTMGAAGPVLGTAIATVMIQVLPTLVYVKVITNRQRVQAKERSRLVMTKPRSRR